MLWVALLFFNRELSAWCSMRSLAITCQEELTDWISTQQVDMPITQQALANELGCRVSEVRVGIYCVETSTHGYVRMKEADIKQAISELQVLLSAVETEVKRLREGNP